VEQHPLKDQIEAERFLASKEASRRPGLGIRLTKLVPDGTTWAKVSGFRLQCFCSRIANIAGCTSLSSVAPTQGQWSD